MRALPLASFSPPRGQAPARGAQRDAVLRQPGGLVLSAAQLGRRQHVGMACLTYFSSQALVSYSMCMIDSRAR